MKRLLALVFAVALFVSCEKHTHGCTDPLATNYNPEATCDDGSCEYN